MPIAEAFDRGQVQTLITLFWGISALLWVTGRRGLAGAVLALSCIFKPTLALFLLWGLFRRQWRFTACFAATATTIALLSTLRFGLQNQLDYLPVISFLSRHGEAIQENQSVMGLLNRLLGNGKIGIWLYDEYPPYRESIYVISTGFSFAFLLIGLALPVFARGQQSVEDFLFFGCVTVMASPISWQHHYGIFFFPLLLLLARSERMSRAACAALAVAWFASGNHLNTLDRFQAGARSLLGDYTLFAGFIVMSLLAAQMFVTYRVSGRYEVRGAGGSSREVAA